MDVEVNINCDGVVVGIFLSASFCTDYLTGVDKSQFLCRASDQSRMCKSATPYGCLTGTVLLGTEPTGLLASLFPKPQPLSWLFHMVQSQIRNLSIILITPFSSGHTCTQLARSIQFISMYL